MISVFENITSQEYDTLRHAIPLITVLIAGADGEIDQEELDWAEKVTKIRSYKLPDKLKDFYKDVGTDYSGILKAIMENYPTDLNARQAKISGELAELSPILDKMNQEYAYELYQSYRSFAKHVAKASGGFLGFGKIGPKEDMWMELEMITPIAEPES